MRDGPQPIRIAARKRIVRSRWSHPGMHTKTDRRRFRDVLRAVAPKVRGRHVRSEFDSLPAGGPRRLVCGRGIGVAIDARHTERNSVRDAVGSQQQLPTGFDGKSADSPNNSPVPEHSHPVIRLSFRRKATSCDPFLQVQCCFLQLFPALMLPCVQHSLPCGLWIHVTPPVQADSRFDSPVLIGRPRSGCSAKAE